MNVRILPRPGGWLVIDPRYTDRPDPETGRRETIWCIAGEGQIRWFWNGDTERPSIQPSYLQTRPGDPTYRNHYFIGGGQVIFGSDSTHAWAGQTLELPEFTPEELAYWETTG